MVNSMSVNIFRLHWIGIQMPNELCNAQNAAKSRKEIGSMQNGARPSLEINMNEWAHDELYDVVTLSWYVIM
jgi:hypothetical protein